MNVLSFQLKFSTLSYINYDNSIRRTEKDCFAHVFSGAVNVFDMRHAQEIINFGNCKHTHGRQPRPPFRQWGVATQLSIVLRVHSVFWGWKRLAGVEKELV